MVYGVNSFECNETNYQIIHKIYRCFHTIFRRPHRFLSPYTAIPRCSDQDDQFNAGRYIDRAQDLHLVTTRTTHFIVNRTLY